MADKWSKLRNTRMAEKLRRGDAVDVSQFPAEPNGKWILPDFRDGADYCDAETESWVWSIGRRHSDGKIIASLDVDLYQNPAFECLWLR